MNTMYKTGSEEETFSGNVAPLKKLVIGNAFKFLPHKSIKNTHFENGGQYCQQTGRKLEILKQYQPKGQSLKTRRLSSDANQQGVGQAYFNGQNGIIDNSLCDTRFGKIDHQNQKSDWRSNESSAASSTNSDCHENLEQTQKRDDSNDYFEGICKHNMHSQHNETTAFGQALEYCEATRGARKKLFKNAEERMQFKQQYEAKKKTELCRNYEMYGHCKFGDQCSYAHGSWQLQKKTHLPSNFMTKLCMQFHQDGQCTYGERCQFLHSVYDLKTDLTYSQSLREGARLTQQRNNQISGESYAECLWANLKTGDGCGAPKGPRLPCFEAIYNKDNKDNQRIIEEEDAIDQMREQFHNSDADIRLNYISTQMPPNSMSPNLVKYKSHNNGLQNSKYQVKQQDKTGNMSYNQRNNTRFYKPLTIQRPFVPPTIQPQPIRCN